MKQVALGIVVKPAKHPSSVGKADPEKEIFRDLNFVIVGCQGNLKDLKAMIENESGTIETTVFIFKQAKLIVGNKKSELCNCFFLPSLPR